MKSWQKIISRGKTNIHVCSLNCRACPRQKCIQNRHKLKRKLNYQALLCENRKFSKQKRPGLFLRTMFLLSIWATGRMYMNFDEKHSPNVLENQTRLQNSAYTTRKSLIFRLLCALFEQIPSVINWDILKNLTWCRAKNSNKLCAPSHLVTWIPPHCCSKWWKSSTIVILPLK